MASFYNLHDSCVYHISLGTLGMHLRLDQMTYIDNSCKEDTRRSTHQLKDAETSCAGKQETIIRNNLNSVRQDLLPKQVNSCS